MANTRPLPPADINPWAKTIENDVDRLRIDADKSLQDSSTALRTANAAIAALSESTQVDDCNLAIEPGSYRAPNAANAPVATAYGHIFVYTTIGPNGVAAIRQEFRRIYIDSDVQDRRLWTRTSIDGGITWTFWYEESSGPTTTRISGAVNVPGNTTVVAYTYAIPVASRDRVAMVSGNWLMQQTLASGSIDFRLRWNTSGGIASYRYSSGLAPSHSVTLSGSVVIPAGQAVTVDFTVASNSPTATSATADSSFWHMYVTVI